jgi:hypothetical protein
MDTDRRELAHYLVAVWPKVTLPVRASDGQRATAPMHLGEFDPDVYLALSMEVRHLVAQCPDLAQALEQAHNGHRGDAPPVDLVEQALATADGHLADALRALLGAAPGTPEVPRGTGLIGRVVAVMPGGWLARVAASLWMNLLVIAAVLLVFFSPWGPATAGDGDAPYVVALKVFALWCLSFLPGWLYIRFLGQRAGALWTEYVVHLHRLGWNRAGYLPRPPADSRFFEEWVADGGPLYDQTRNLYRLKFEAYYGKAVVEGMQGTNFAVRVDTMFPVFLATAIFAACWAAVLTEPDFLTRPSSLWDMLRFAFLGAYAFLVQSLIRRFFQSDLKPSAYAAAVLRIVLVLLVMTALHQVLVGSSTRVEAATAFVVGVFPIIAVQALQRVAASTLRVVVPQLTPDYPLNQVDGLNIWYESRLLEEGIEDMQNLATANLVDIILHTRVPVGRLVDWVDQSLLYVHLDRVERGYGERRLVRRARNLELKAAAKTQAAAGGAATGDGPTEAPAEQSAQGRVHGSVNHALRAGTQSRVAFRQLGIRTATDLLKAFPPDLIDAYEQPLPGTPTFKKLKPHLEHLDEDQIRTLVRVLDENPNLAPVWNWQARGPEARNRARRPRSARRGTSPDSGPEERPPDSSGSARPETSGAPPPEGTGLRTGRQDQAYGAPSGSTVS